MTLNGKVALVTGAAQGIGKEIALTFAREGATVVVNDINISAASDVTKEISKFGGSSIAIRADVSNYQEVEEMVEETIAQFGKIDILVNVAAIHHQGNKKAEELSLDGWNRMMAVTLGGVFICSQLVGRVMIKNKNGKIINISSVDGIAASPLHCHYIAAKFGVVGLTQALAVEWAEHGINVNCICPGFTETPTNQEVRRQEEYVRQRIARIPLGRLAKPSDQANLALFLASENSNYITGQVIACDGGTTTMNSGYVRMSKEVLDTYKK